MSLTITALALSVSFTVSALKPIPITFAPVSLTKDGFHWIKMASVLYTNEYPVCMASGWYYVLNLNTCQHERVWIMKGRRLAYGSCERGERSRENQ